MRLRFFLSFILLGSFLFSEEAALPSKPLWVKIVTSIINKDQVVDWSNTVDQDTLNGKPLVVRIEGDNFRLIVTFTCFYQDENNALLVAQSEVIHSDEQNRGVSKSVLSQMVKMGTPLVYYPLGKEKKSLEGHSMVMEILLRFNKGDQN